MKPEDKQLLLADLCARLPYGVYVQIVDRVGFTHHTVELNPEVIQKMWSYKSIKPYLRPLSTMTEEETVEYCDLQDKFLLSSQYPVTDGYALFDWLNKKMFDFRGLIPKGLALSTEEYNPYKD